MSIKGTKEFMKKNSEKFTPIKVVDKELLERIEEIRNERRGFRLMLSDLAKIRNAVDEKEKDWWGRVYKKYNISTKYELAYNYEKKEIKRRQKSE